VTDGPGQLERRSKSIITAAERHNDIEIGRRCPLPTSVMSLTKATATTTGCINHCSEGSRFSSAHSRGNAGIQTSEEEQNPARIAQQPQILAITLSASNIPGPSGQNASTSTTAPRSPKVTVERKDGSPALVLATRLETPAHIIASAKTKRRWAHLRLFFKMAEARTGKIRKFRRAAAKIASQGADFYCLDHLICCCK